MNPTPQQVQSIRSFVAGMAGVWSNTDAQIRAAMAATQVANPLTQATGLDKPFTPTQLFQTLSTASQSNLKTFGGLGQLMVDAVAMNRPQCQLWTNFMATTSIITAAEKTAMLAIINATQSDPAWTAQVAWDVANLGRVADDFDIEAARNS